MEEVLFLKCCCSIYQKEFLSESFTMSVWDGHVKVLTPPSSDSKSELVQAWQHAHVIRAWWLEVSVIGIHWPWTSWNLNLYPQCTLALLSVLLGNIHKKSWGIHIVQWKRCNIVKLEAGLLPMNVMLNQSFVVQDALHTRDLPREYLVIWSLGQDPLTNSQKIDFGRLTC